MQGRAKVPAGRSVRYGMSTYAARVHEWPSIGDGTDAGVVARIAICRRAESEAYAAGHDTVRLVGAWDVTLDAFPVDRRRFTAVEGQRVRFPSKSAPCGDRVGRAVKVTDTRVRVAYTFKHGGTSEKWVPARDVRPIR